MLIVQVEDDKSFQQAVSKEFKARQLEIVAFDNAIHAGNYLEQVEPDIVLIDYRLGGPNGLKLAARIRELYSACTIVLISAYATKHEVRDAFRSGIDDFLFKPIEVQDLISELFTAFRRKRASYPQNLSSHQGAEAQAILDEAKQTLFWNKQLIKLTPIEWHLLTTLVSNPNQVFSAHELYSIATGNHIAPDQAQHIIGVHLVNLRRKLKNNNGDSSPILNVRGKGYKWIDQGEAEA